jgi:hypothetical protein
VGRKMLEESVGVEGGRKDGVGWKCEKKGVG